MSNNPLSHDVQLHFDFDNLNGHTEWSEKLVSLFDFGINQEVEAFDRDSAGSAGKCNALEPELIAAFVEGFLAETESAEICEHLHQCSCCSEVVVDFARAMQLQDFDFDQQEELPSIDEFQAKVLPERHLWIDWFQRIGLRPDGLTMFPDGTIADGAWEFGHLLEGSNVNEKLQVIAKVVADQISTEVKNRSVLIVAFSDAMHRLSIEVAALMKCESQDWDIHVAGVKRFHEPTLLCKPRIIKGTTVVLVTDVVRSGKLLDSLWNIVADKEPAEIRAFAMINQEYSGIYEEALSSLACEARSERISNNGSSDDHFALRYFDPVSGKSRAEFDSKKEKTWCVEGIADLLPLIDGAGAFKRNHRIGRSTYPFAIDVISLLENDSAFETLATMARDFCLSLDQSKNWIFAFPADRAGRAGRVAQLLSGVSGWQNVALGSFDDSCFLNISSETSLQIERSDGVIVVDAAIRSGATLRSQVEVLQEHYLPKIEAFYVLDLRRERDRVAHELEIGIPINSMFQIPFGFAPAESVKHLLKARFEPLARSIDSSNYSDPVKAVMKTFYQRMFETKRRAWSQDVVGEKIEPVLQKGAADPMALVEDMATGQRPNFSLTGFLDAEIGLMDESQHRDANYTINNTATPGLLKELALTLTSHGDYGWFNRNWLLLHEPLITSADSRWDFLSAVAFDAVRRAPSSAMEMHDAVVEYRAAVDDRAKKSANEMLFELPADPRITAGCDVLEEILSKPHETMKFEPA